MKERASEEAQEAFRIIRISRDMSNAVMVARYGYQASQIEKEGVTVDKLLAACKKLFPDLNIQIEDDITRIAEGILKEHPELAQQIQNTYPTEHRISPELRRAFIIMQYNASLLPKQIVESGRL